MPFCTSLLNFKPLVQLRKSQFKISLKNGDFTFSPYQGKLQVESSQTYAQLLQVSSKLLTDKGLKPLERKNLSKKF